MAFLALPKTMSYGLNLLRAATVAAAKLSTRSRADQLQNRLLNLSQCVVRQDAKRLANLTTDHNQQLPPQAAYVSGIPAVHTPSLQQEMHDLREAYHHFSPNANGISQPRIATDLVNGRLLKKNHPLTKAFSNVDRIYFAGKRTEDAHLHVAVPLACEKHVIQAPSMHALKLMSVYPAIEQALEEGRPAHVLFVGIGSGWMIGAVAQLVSPHGTVTGVDDFEPIVLHARAALSSCPATKYQFATGSVQVLEGDGLTDVSAIPGHREDIFDVIISQAASSDIPMMLLARMRPGGRMVFPQGSRKHNSLTVVKKESDDHIDVTELVKQIHLDLPRDSAKTEPPQAFDDNGNSQTIFHQGASSSSSSSSSSVTSEDQRKPSSLH